MIRKALTLALVCSASMTCLEAQAISIGVKGGVPLTDAFEVANGNNSAFVTKTKRYTVGPTVEFHLPARFSVEVDALYKRMGFDSQTTTVTTQQFNATTANSCEFPVLGKFEVFPGPVRPFIDAGANFRHITGVKQVQTVISGATFHQVEIANPPEFNKDTDVGFAFGAGIAFKLGRVRISPEFRYTRWGGENFRDPVNALLRTNRNEGTFLLGFTF